MKTPSTQRWLSTLILLIAGFFSLLAQDAPNRTVLIQKITHDDGTETVIKKNLASDQDLAKALHDFKLDNPDHVTILFMNGHEMEFHRKGKAFMERGPCQVFIGVTVGGQGPDGFGVRIAEVIPNTSAEKAGLTAGDVILRLDDEETNSYSALVRERNKHQPGDWYTLSILRDGQVLDVEAQFKPCDPDPNDSPASQPAPDPVFEQTNPVDPVQSVNYTLDLQDFSVSPNPSYGEVHIRFQADPKPTIIRISDSNGKILFEEYRPDFEGYYARPIDLANAQPGLLLLSIQQEDKFVSKKIILLART